MIDVFLVTGFLGTGKTSLINAYVEGLDTSRTGIIVNEAGDTRFDGALIAEATGDESSVRMLGNGCLCCQAADDLAIAVRALHALHLERTGAPTERIVIEASGLAMPGRLLRQLQGVRDLPLRIHVIATVEATRTASPSKHPEILAQWAAASTLVLTRSDIATDAGRASIAVARAISPLSRCVVEPDPMRRAVAAFAETEPVSVGHVLDTAATTSHGVSVHTLRQIGEADWDDCAEWFDNLAGIAGERLLRVKAIVRPRGPSAWIVQAVGTTFAAPRTTTIADDGHVVVIARGMEEVEFEAIEPTGLFAAGASAHAHV